MKLIFVRHGIASGVSSENQALDFVRVLTAEGKKNLNKVFKTFKKNRQPIDVIFASPLCRTVQTAEILWGYFPAADLELMPVLDKLDDPQNLVEYISFLPSHGCYTFVGHEPHLSQVIAKLLSLHPDHEFLSLKKGGICILEGGMWQGFKLELLLNPKFLKAH